MSDQRLDQIGWAPPRAGYLNLTQLPDSFTGTPSVQEPTNYYLVNAAGETDGEKLTSTRATTCSGWGPFCGNA